MPLQAFRSIPRDIVEWARYFTSLVITPDPGTITDDTFANRAAHSVIGRAGDTPGAPADITAGADRRVLIRHSGVVQFDGLEVADLPSSVATDSEVASAQAAAEATAAAALAAHVADSDPHSVYLTQTEGDARYLLQANVLNGSATYDPPDLAAGAVAVTTVAVSGAAAGDFALASHADVATSNADKVSLTAKVTAADTVTVVFRNDHTTNVNLASGTLRARVWKQ